MRALGIIEDALLAQRGHLIGWVPLCLGTGIGIYFNLKAEPQFVAILCVAVGALLLLVAARFVWIAFAPIVLGISLILAGFGLAKWRTEFVADNVLKFRYYGAIEGRVVDIDRSASDAVRLTLDRVVLERMDPSRTPGHVRISLHGNQPLADVKPGDVLIMTGHLSPPSGPAEPGGFDFRRHAWFDGLGAIGYTRNPVLRLAPAKTDSIAMWIFSRRMALSHAVQAKLTGEAGAFAAAIMTGDRSGMGQNTLAALRASNLAHLLAISGLHMGLLTSFVFAVIRYGLALLPGFALRWHSKKIAAVFALFAAASYLALSGGNVATERAFIMVAVMLVAVLLDRRALTLRAVAMAAIIVLILQPESLLGPGFQMSFAATTALVAVFGWLRHRDLSKLPKWTRPVLSVVLSSLVAGLATAPIAAAHFNQISHYGLIANLLSVPLMGILVMPAAVLAVCLAPFGGWGLGLWLMGLGLRWILFVAETVAGTDGALSHVQMPQQAVLPIFTIGMLWLILWQGRVRMAGVFGVAVAFMLWFGSQRPTILVADTGGLVGIMTPDGRSLSKQSGSGFVAKIWLENDGQPVGQEVAGQRPGMSRDGRVFSADLATWQVLQVSGKTALAALNGCDGADILISNVEDAVTRPCLVYDMIRLRDTGALAIDVGEDGRLVVTTAQDVAGSRPWNSGANHANGHGTILMLTATTN